MTAPSINDISLKVFDPIAFYPSGGPAFTNFPDTASTAANDPDFCEKTYTATITPNSAANAVTTFNFDATTKRFQIFSNSIN